ncbi:MAG TPA: hemolysin family protein [Thermoanaerobaculia bacterium]|nr:hemolysin family protein [Thermoanaerobaculia bacterium]
MDAWYVILALLFVLANGFFVAAEFAIVKVRPTQLSALVTKGSSRARMARRLTKDLDAYLSATQLGITLASLALGWIGEPAFARLIEPLFARAGSASAAYAHSISATIAFTIISILHIVIGELAPKSIAIQKPVGTSLWLAHLLHLFYVAMYPAIWLLNGVSRALLRAVGIRPVHDIEMAHSPEELRIILSGSEKAGILSEENREIIEGVFQFSKRTARQIMVPRTDVVVLSTKKSIEQNLEIIRTTRHTRYPLCDGTLDQTVGLIHVKDLLLAQLRGPGRPLMELKRDVLFIPENSTVDAVLQQFIENKTHMAVVLDEYGGASGIVSLENITEELFGQIQDEFDRERPEIEPLGNGRYRVRGDYLIEDLADRLKVDVGEPDEETIGGYVAARIGREVTAGDRCELGELSISVIEAERFRVRWVLVEAKAPETEMEEETEEVEESKV